MEEQTQGMVASGPLIGPLLVMVGLFAFAGSCSAQAGGVMDIVGGAPRTVQGRVVARLGTADGPGILEGRPMPRGVAELPRGSGYLVTTGSSVVLFPRSGDPQTIGRRGRGPGEYVRPMFFRIDPQGHVWVFDQLTQRATLIWPAPAGEWETVPLRSPGRFQDALFLPGGELIVHAIGSESGNLGFLIHQRSPATDTWTAHIPLFRNSQISYYDPRWIRILGLSPSGRLAMVDPISYLIEVRDPMNEYHATAQVRRHPPKWPSDLPTFRNGNWIPVPPEAEVLDVLFQDESLLWVLSRLDGDDRETLPVSRDGRVAETPVSGAELDRKNDTLVELLDLSAGTVRASYKLAVFASQFVGPGRVAHYAQDVPYPMVEIIDVHDTTGRGGMR